MGEEEATPIEATVEQTENPVDYANGEQLGPEGTPPAQEIEEPTLSGSTVGGRTDIQINAEDPALPVTASAEPDFVDMTVTDSPEEIATDITTTEDTMHEEANAATDIAAKVKTINEQAVIFVTEFDAAHAAHDDLLKQILDLMAERTRLLTILRDSLASVNAHLAEFNAEKVDV